MSKMKKGRLSVQSHENGTEYAGKAQEVRQSLGSSVNKN